MKISFILNLLGGYIALLYNRTSCFTIQVTNVSLIFSPCFSDLDIAQTTSPQEH